MDNTPTPTHPAAAENSVAAPVNPESSQKHNSWTRPKMAQFLQALADTGSVSTAANSVGMSRQSAYRLRSRLIGQPFDITWDGALEFGIQQVAHAALDRALNGTVVPVYYKGEQVGERRVFNERAVMNLMAGAERIGRNPIGRDLTSRNWRDMLGRVQAGPLVWTDDEYACIDPDHPAHTEHGTDNIWRALPIDPASRAQEIGEAAEHFAEHESHYAKDYATEHSGNKRRGIFR